MKNFKKDILIASLLSIIMIFSGCASWNKTQKGAAVGTATGGAAGAIVGRAAGNTAMGAIVGAAVGGTAGAIIGRQMDKQAEEIKNSVPDAKVERVGEGIVVEFNSNILFGFDRSDLSEDAKVNLNNLVTVLNNYPDTDIEVQGHTDSKGTEAYNQALSERRANSVSGYLIGNGISDSRISIVGYGENFPKYTNDTEDGRALNRRVEFMITANEKMKAEAEQQIQN
jgi:outer membrane protein OmpA-like peptidoglycan-associated protein